MIALLIKPICNHIAILYGHYSDVINYTVLHNRIFILVGAFAILSQNSDQTYLYPC